MTARVALLTAAALVAAHAIDQRLHPPRVVVVNVEADVGPAWFPPRKT